MTMWLPCCLHATLFRCAVMPWSNITVDMRRFGAVCCRWHVAVFAVLFACSLMSLFCLDPKLVSTCVILAPSTVDSFMWARRYSAAMLLFFRRYLSFLDSCACVSVDCSCARVPVGLWTARPVCPCARGFLVCPCARGFLVCPCARESVACPCARVPVCPEAREETYLPKTKTVRFFKK